MIASEFDYTAATTIEEALQLLIAHGDEAKILAGGHSLIPLMKMRLSAPRVLIDIGGIHGLRGIQSHELEKQVEIGALETHAEVAESELLAVVCPLLRETAAEIGDVQVRNRGTIGGSLAHADPAADYPAAILALEAEIAVQGPKGERNIAAKDFFTDTFQSALHPGEILTRIRIRHADPHTGWAYMKVHHPASGYAVVGVAVILTLDGRGNIQRARVGITGLATKAFRATGVESALEGKHGDPGVLHAAARKAADGVEPLSDLHASAEYRAALARVHTRRALERALSRALKA